MEDKTFEVLGCLAGYDNTLYRAMRAYSQTYADTDCDADTQQLCENFVIAIMLDKIQKLMPEDAEVCQRIMAEASQRAGELLPNEENVGLLEQAALSYALALSQSHWGWRPWNNVCDILTEEDED
jgi:hypothetical protein